MSNKVRRAWLKKAAAYIARREGFLIGAMYYESNGFPEEQILADADSLLADSKDGLKEEEGEKCQKCGEHYLTVYRVPDEVWKVITPKPYAPGAGLLCPLCAESLSRAAGITLYWEASPGEFPCQIERNKRITAERRAWYERKRREAAERRNA